MREVVNGIFHVLSTGCQWEFIPKDVPPKSTGYEYYRLFDWDGTLDNIYYGLYIRVRKLAGKEASPIAAILDSQSVKAAEQGGASLDPIGYDTGKKINGIRCHIVVDTLGMILAEKIQPANVQDRDGAIPVLQEARRIFVFIKNIFADGGYQGEATATAVAALGQWELEIVKRSDTTKGFVVLPKRWIVERTFGWLGRCRRLAKHFECMARTAFALLRLAMIRLMLRRIARAIAWKQQSYQIDSKEEVESNPIGCLLTQILLRFQPGCIRQIQPPRLQPGAQPAPEDAPTPPPHKR